MTVDLFIDNALLLTMRGSGVGAIPGGSIAITGNRISAVGLGNELADHRRRANRVINGERKVVLPGFVDAHIHSSLALLRGVSQDMYHWMQLGLWPFARHMNSSDDMAGTRLAAIEALLAGTTLIGDYDGHVHEACAFYEELGIRARVASTINEMGTDNAGLEPGDLYRFDPAVGEADLKSNLELINNWQGAAGGRITCMMGPQAPDMMSVELLREIYEQAERHDVMVHMHVAQGDRETEQMVKRYGQRSIPWLAEQGLLSPRLLAAHLTEATTDEVGMVAGCGAALVCCPGSIAIIDGIVTPVMEFINAGGRVALGSDQAPGNNGANMFNEMKLLALLNKVKFGDPAVMPAGKALRMATRDGALAIGLSDVGMLDAGMLADLIIVDLDSPALAPYIERPLRNVVPNLVYSARGHEVEMVIIDGRVVVEERRVVTVDAREVVRDAVRAADRVSRLVNEQELSQEVLRLRDRELL